MTVDMFGHLPRTEKSGNTKDTRNSVASEKAELCFRLNRLCKTVPDSVKNGSVQLVRKWQADQSKAMKVFISSKSSVNELTCAINQMLSYK